MIVLRNKEFSDNFRFLALFKKSIKSVSKDYNEDLGDDKILDDTIKKVISGLSLSEIAKKIYSYESDYMKDNKISESSLKNWLSISGVSTNNGEISIMLSPTKDLLKYYSSTWTWCLDFDGKSGKFIGVSSFD